MRRSLIALCVLILLSAHLYAQKTEDFVVPTVTNTIKNSHYNTFKCLDARTDTTFMGIVQLGALNRKAKVVPQIPLPKLLGTVFNSLTDETAQKGELILQIRQFCFAEVETGFSEKGYCYIRAEAYSNKSGQYQKVNTLDTVICLKSSLDVTDIILKGGANAITGFISASLIMNGSGPAYAYADILDIDNYEKRSLKVFNTSKFTDGLYLTYKSFRDQAPDKQITLADHDPNMGADINSGTVKAPGENGKLEKVKADRIYAVVYDGQPFVATKFGYYPLLKVNNDLTFTGKAKVSASSGDVFVASMFFGVIGGLLAQNVESTFDMKIDHLNGGFIRLREIVQKAPADSGN